MQIKKTYKTIVVVLISFVLLFYFLSLLDIGKFISLLKRISVPWVTIGIILFLLQIIIKGLRFKHLLGIKNKSLKKLYGVVGGWSILKYILPGAFGELSILYLLKKIIKIDYSKNTSALFIARTIDFMLFTVLFIVLYIFSFTLFIDPVIKNIADILLLIVVVIFFLSIVFLKAQKSVYRFMHKSFFQKHSIGKKIKVFAINFLKHFKRLMSIKSILYLSAISILMWALIYAMFVASIKAIHVDLNLLEILFIFLVLWPISILPIRGIGNLGSHELGWIMPLVLLGYSQSNAAIIAFGTHVIFYINLVGLIIFMLVMFGKNILFYVKK